MAIKRNLSSPLAASVFDGPGDGKKKKKKKGNEDVSKWTDEQWKKYKGSKAHREFLKEQHESPVRRRHQKLLDKKDKGTFDVEVDGKSYPVKGKKVVKTRGNKTTTTFKARGGKDTPIRRIKDKVVKKDGKVLKNIKKTKYRP